MIDLLMPTIAQGLLWAIMALGVYITYRVLDIADLTVEGSFPLGAAVAASLLAGGYSPWLAFGAAMLAGMLAGVATGLLHTKLKIPALLAGILTMIALYSVNLRVMGKANLSLLRVDTVFSIMRDIGGFSNAQAVLCVGIVSSLLIGGLIYWFFGTEIGAAIRATGFNPQMIRAQGVDTNFTIILGLLISNALVALSGALVAQNNGFATSAWVQARSLSVWLQSLSVRYCLVPAALKTASSALCWALSFIVWLLPLYCRWECRQTI